MSDCTSSYTRALSGCNFEQISSLTRLVFLVDNEHVLTRLLNMSVDVKILYSSCKEQGKVRKYCFELW